MASSYFCTRFNMARDQHLHLRPGFLVCVFAFDKDLFDLAGVEVADRPFYKSPSS